MLRFVLHRIAKERPTARAKARPAACVRLNPALPHESILYDRGIVSALSRFRWDFEILDLLFNVVNKIGGAGAVDNSMIERERKRDHFDGFVFGGILMFLLS